MSEAAGRTRPRFVAGQPGRRAFCARNLLDPRAAVRRLDTHRRWYRPCGRHRSAAESRARCESGRLTGIARHSRRPAIRVTEAFEHDTFFTRLHHFVLVSDAFVVVPDGIGTVLETMMVWQLLIGRTKIVATIGPASSAPEVLRQLL